jgi:hypothetical protein
VPNTVQHRAQADQGLVPEPKVSMSANICLLWLDGNCCITLHESVMAN